MNDLTLSIEGQRKLFFPFLSPTPLLFLPAKYKKNKRKKKGKKILIMQECVEIKTKKESSIK